MKSRLLTFLFLFCSVLVYSQYLDSAKAASFMDGVMKVKLKDKNIVGATVAILQDGKVVLANGYGVADIKTQRPINPATTLFRIGSISKLFVWTSIMQLMAQGKLDLDADINHYMQDVTIPEKYGQPITLRHLMTHTPGFEDHILNLFGKDSSSLKPMGDLLRKEMPARVRAPFTQAAYSNHGTAMAAYIVEKISGLSFDDYVNKNIITPLEMSNTTFRQPLPASLASQMSKGYRVENNESVEEAFEYVPLYPIGAASSTALDMMHLMLAYLRNGNYNGYQLLDSATLGMMMSPAHQHHPAVNPMRYGFMDLSQNGETLIGHGGDTFWFHSGFFFLPKHDTGIFISFNTDQGAQAYMDVIEAFMDEYFPDERPLTTPMKTDKHWLTQFAGEYRANRYSFSDLLKIGSLAGRVQIVVADDERLKVTTDTETTYMVPIDSTTFREEHKSDQMAFGKDARGIIKYCYLGLLPIFALEKVSWIDRSSTHMGLFFITIILMLTALCYWPIVYRIRRKYQATGRVSQTLPVLAKAVAWFNYLLLLLFLVATVVSLRVPFDIVYDVPALLKTALVFPLLMIVTTVGMLVLGARLLNNDQYKMRSRIYYVMLTVGSVLCLLQLSYWNLIGFNY
ncbi:MAG: beta-lactamase family protein [Cyclobacteriaceae bacterium]|nr:beta-lactamase family protein [Cyclobacteriaceae bacterium]MDH4298066.1 beta-lactamase family protein [Cyclobacteriaceae bacterium]MDH5250197.1 beta-lactamase family protein [Cyclobacteriaceae bacterium]